MKGKFLFWLILVAIAVHFVVSHSAHAQNNLVGKVAPELSIENFLQAPEGKMSWEKLKEKVVILEFWATWCAPCIAQIPHLNELAEEFSNEPVQFISITDEDELKVARFLKKREMKSWIGLDKDRSVFNAYGVSGIPITFLVDPQSKVAAVLHPKNLKAQMIADLIAGKNPIKDRPVEQAKSIESKDSPTTVEEPPLFEILIKPIGQREFPWYAFNPAKGELDAKAITLHQALSLAHDISTVRIVGSDSILSRWFQISIKLPKEQIDQFEQEFQSSLNTAFGLSLQREKKKVEVFIVRAPSGATKGLYLSQTESFHLSTDSGLILAAHAEIDDLCRNLENVLNRPVVNETGLQERYDWDLEYDEESSDSIINALKEQLGLGIKLEKREFDVLVVESKLSKK